MVDFTKVDEATDTIESYFTAAYRWTRTHQAVVRLIGGGIILVYSPRLSCTLLLATAIRGVGLPLLQKSFGELYASYRQAKKAVKEEGPALNSSVAKLQSVTAEVRELEAIVKELQAMKTPDVDKIKSNMEKAKKDIARLTDASGEAAAVAQRINSKLNYKQLHSTLHDLYLVTLSALASARSTTVANCSIAINLGATITKHLQALVKKYEATIVAEAKKIDDKLEADTDNISAQIAGALLEPTKLASQLNTLAFIIGNSVALSVALYATAWSRLLAATHLGAELVVDALEELVDPVLAGQSVPVVYTVKNNAVYLQSLFAGLGVAASIYLYLPGTNGPVSSLLLAPLLVVESFAKAIVVSA
jgi:hypothetical protein